MERIRLRLTPDLEVFFTDRDLALRKVEEWAERSTRHPQVVFGPKGCGKTAWLRQSAVLLKELGFHVLYIDVLHRYFEAYTDLKEVVKRLAEASADAIGYAELRLATLAIDLAKFLIERRRRKIAVLVDDVFQAIGLDKAAVYVKGLLGLIEYPPRSVDAIVVVVATSEGATRREIGRHRWADLMPMWNMPREGFRQLYDQIPGEKPPFDYLWRVTGGNPELLATLYKAGWDVGKIAKMLVKRGKLMEFVASVDELEKRLLHHAVEDPDVLMSMEGIPLLEKLVDLNFVVDELYPRDPWFWVGEVPPERDPELGIGRNVAWQTPLHREAVRTALRYA